MIEKVMLRLGYVPIATMTEAVNKVAADMAVDHLVVEGAYLERQTLLEAELAAAKDALSTSTSSIAVEVRRYGQRAAEYVS